MKITSTESTASREVRDLASVSKDVNQNRQTKAEEERIAQERALREKALEEMREEQREKNLVQSAYQIEA